jgi:Mycothiol maleylpyruvate isomerase N-terminal domain
MPGSGGQVDVPNSHPSIWSTPTRCNRWDVAALVAHVCPDPAMFDMLDGAKIDGPAAVTEAAELFGRFNAADGIAHTKADEFAEQAVSDAETLASECSAAT